MADTKFNLNFKYGSSYAALKALPISNGTIYVTKEEKAMYVDLDGARIRLGQTISFATWDDFDKSVTLPPQSPEAFYYIEKDNALLKYVGYNVDDAGNISGGTWKQINSTAAIQAVVDDLVTRMGVAEGTITQHTSAIGKKTDAADDDGSLHARLNAEIARATAAEGAIAEDLAELDEEVGDKIVAELPTVASTVKSTGIYAYLAAEKAARESADQIHSANITSLNGEITNLKTKDEALEKAIDDEAKRADEEEKRLAGLIAAEETRAKAAEQKNAGDISTINGTITGIQGDITNINNDIDALEQADVQIRQSITDLTSTVGQNKTDLQAAIDAEKTRAEGVESGLNNRIGTIETAAVNYATKQNVEDAVAAEKSRAEGVEEALDKRLDDAEAAISGHDDRLNTLETDVGTAKQDISAIKGNITSIQGTLANKTDKTYVDQEIAKINAEIGDPAVGDPANGGTAATGLYALIDTLSGGAAGLESRVVQAEKDIDALEEADKTINAELVSIKSNYVKVSDYNAKVQTLETGIGNNKTAIEALQTRADNIESAANTLAGRVTTAENNITVHDGLLTTHTGKISALEEGLDDLVDYVGTIPADSSATNVIEYINSQFAAADAMTYIGGVASVTELVGKTGVNAGDTYVITTNHTNDNVSYYAGDMMVAAKDGASAIGDWTHVTTGYQASQENKLVAKNNGVELQSYAGTSLGSLAISSDNLTVSTTNQANPSGGYITNVKMNLEWGTF